MGMYTQLTDNQSFSNNPNINKIDVPNNLNFLGQINLNNPEPTSLNGLLGINQTNNNTPLPTPLQRKSFQVIHPNTNKLRPNVINSQNPKQGKLKSFVNNIGEIPEPSIFDVASAINIFRAADNYTQPKPPIVRLNRVDIKQQKLNEQPYQQMSDAIVGQNQGIMETIKRGSSTASSLLSAGNQLASSNIKGQNQVAMNYSNAAQQVMAQNIGQANQANAANTEIGNQELLQNMQMQMQHAQMKKESTDNNINAAMAAQAQKVQFNQQKEFSDKTEKIQARNLEFQQKYRDYWTKRNDPDFQQKIHNERGKVMDSYNKEFGFGSPNYDTEVNRLTKEVNSKKIDDYKNVIDINQYNQEIKDAKTDKKKIDEINAKYKKAIVDELSERYVRHGLSDYMSKNYKLDDILTRELGKAPTLDFSDILND